MSNKAPVRRALGPANVPSAVLHRSSIATPHYVDWFAIPSDNTATPERCARTMFGDTPGWLAKLIWSGLLGLRLIHEPSPDNIAGYRVAVRSDHWIRLEARSRSLTSYLIVAVDDDGLSLAALMRYDRWPGKLRWSLLSPLHRALAPGLLARTAAAVAGTCAPERALSRDSG